MVPANVDLVNSGSQWLQGTLVDFKICSNNYSSQTNEAVSKMWVNLHFDTASLLYYSFLNLVKDILVFISECL